MHSLIAYRVLARFLCRADLMGDPKELFARLAETKQKLDALEVYLPDILAGEAIIAENYRARWNPSPEDRPIIQKLEEAETKLSIGEKRAFVGFMEVCSKLFLAILQTLDLPKSTRSKVEKQSRKWVRSRGIKFRGRASEVYFTEKQLVDDAYDAAKEALAVGKPIEARATVGSFKLVNTGGFKADVMEGAGAAVAKAEQLLRAKGFGEVCYGEVYVTKTLHGGSNVMAFYMPAQDALFIRANFRQAKDLVYNILHELAHRLDHKFLQGKQREINQVYADLNTHARFLYRPTDIPKPVPGEEILVNRKPLVIDRVLGDKVYLREPDETEPSNKFIRMNAYRLIKKQLEGKPPWGDEGFPSEYASKSPGENFAEMVAAYCLGKLSPPLQEMLKTIV